MAIYGNKGLILRAAGKLSTSRDGLSTGKCVFQFPPNRWDLVPENGAVHPHANFCVQEKVEVAFTTGFWLATCDFVGVQQESTPKRFGLTRRVRPEPIETNPDFVTKIGGKPSAPLNGAIFLDETGHPTSDDLLGVFDRFRLVVDTGSGQKRNELAGTESYFAPTNTVWRARWSSRVKPTLTKEVGKIDSSPLGSPPDFGSDFTWLYMGIDSDQRGNSWSNSEDWLLGRWSEKIYAPSA